MTPTGIIVIWKGTVETIPPGWAPCDGTNGTPDLTDAFIPGAGDLYEPYDRQGDVEHDHYTWGGSHTHDMAAGSDLNAGTHLDNKTNTNTVVIQTGSSSQVPPYKAMVYIMKL